MASTDHQLASRYAKAYLQVLNELGKNEFESFEKELVALSTLTKENLGEFFKSPLFELAEKKSVLDKVFEGFQASTETKRFVYALNQANHIHLLDEVSTFFAKELLEQEGQVRVELKTAYPLQGEEEKRIETVFAKVFGKKVFIEKEVDPALIGGISANVGGVVYDASIAGYLDRLEKQFNG